MASKQIQCEICCNEHAVGYCKTCGYVGETCVNIHKTGKMFQTHTVIMHEAVKMDESGTETPKIISRDITEERCKQHPTERAIFLCNIHDSVICGRCLHSEHLSCGKEVVDLLREVVNFDCEKVNTMKSVLKEVKDEIMFLKNDAEQSKQSYQTNADRCMQECMELGNKIKRRVNELTSGIRDDITETQNENLATHSHITKLCDEKTNWCEDEESKIDNFVDNNMAGHLYLMSRQFDKEVSDTRSHIKEIKHKHTFTGGDFKENKVILKCMFEDLEEVCEQQEEVTGSDDGNASDVVTSTTKLNKTRRELTALLNQAKHELDKSDKTQKELRDELKRVKQDLSRSEKTRKQFEQELLKAKQDIEKYEKTRKQFDQELLKAKQDIEKSEKTRKQFEQDLLKAKQDIEKSEKTRKQFEQDLLKTKQDIEKYEKTQKELRDELKGVKQDLYHSEKERADVKAQLSPLQDKIKWTQPTGTVDVKNTTDSIGGRILNLVFTFPDGIQTTHHPSPGKPYKGGTFTGRLFLTPETQLLCRMLKAAFRRRMMFIVGKEGKIVLDGISLYDGYAFYRFGLTPAYCKYILTLKAELAAKGVKEADIDPTENLEETFIVDGP